MIDTAVGYLIGAGLMIAAGLVEVALGVDAEQKSLEDLASPLSATDGQRPAGDKAAVEGGRPSAADRVAGPYPPPRNRLTRQSWAPLPQASVYPRENRYLEAEVNLLVEALRRRGPLSTTDLGVEVRAGLWGPGRLRGAIRSGLASGRIRRLGRGLFVAGATDEPVDQLDAVEERSDQR